MPMTLEHVVHSLYSAGPTQKCAPVDCPLCAKVDGQIPSVYVHTFSMGQDHLSLTLRRMRTNSILITNLSADKLESMTAYIEAWDKTMIRWRTWLSWT